jgi:hypothetical protein
MSPEAIRASVYASTSSVTVSVTALGRWKSPIGVTIVSLDAVRTPYALGGNRLSSVLP